MIVRMIWTKKDRLLLNIIVEFGNQSIRTTDAANAFSRATIKPQIDEFGSYDPSTHIFRWRNGMNTTMLDMIRNHYMSVFGSDKTLVKLFRPTVHLEARYQFVIPYLMDILNAAFHVIRMRHGSHIIYGLVKINVPNSIDFDRFEQALMVYRHTFTKRATRKRVTRKRTTRRRM